MRVPHASFCWAPPSVLSSLCKMTFLSQLATRIHQIGAAEASALPLPPATLWTDCMGTAEKPLIFTSHFTVGTLAGSHHWLWSRDFEKSRKRGRGRGGELRKELRDDKPTWREDTQEKRRAKCIVDFSLLKKRKFKKKKTTTPNMFAKTICFNHIFGL